MLLYVIVNNENGKRYVGHTTETLGEAWDRHVRRSLRRVNFPLYRDFRKHGLSGFSITEAGHYLSSEDLWKAEERLIWVFHTDEEEFGYNATRKEPVPSTSTETRRGTVYCITNLVNAKVYVGKTIMPLTQRWASHKTAAKDNTYVGLIYRAMRKYGVENFTIKALENYEDAATLNDGEIAWIKKLNATDPNAGYNMTLGGEGRLGVKISDEHKKIMSLTHKGKPKPVTQRKKMSASWDEERRDRQAEVARRVNAIENAKLKDYRCDLCKTLFTQVKKGVYGVHRRTCMRLHGAKKTKPAPLYDESLP